MKTLAFILVIATAGVAQAQTRPTLAAAVGAGVDIEPARDVMNRTVTSTLGSYEFEGEIQWRELGLIARGVGTDGSIDFHNVGFDRLELMLGGGWRPFASRVAGQEWHHMVARRFTLEAGLAYQHIVAALDDANTLGLHVGFHGDLPLVQHEGSRVPFVRIIVQRTFIFAGDTVTNTAFGAARIDPGTPAIQMLVAFGIAW
jgi:hypothetical protein